MSERRLLKWAVLKKWTPRQRSPRNLGLAVAQLSVPIGILIAFGSPYPADRMAAHRKSDQRRVDTRFRLLKYCSRSEPSVENCGSPTLRFGEVLDFSLSFCPRHPAAWPAAFQVMFKNKAEYSSCCAMCSARIFKAACPLFGFSCSFHFISRMRYHRLYQVSVVVVCPPGDAPRPERTRTVTRRGR